MRTSGRWLMIASFISLRVMKEDLTSPDYPDFNSRKTLL
jgi:hypothetical protein